MAIWAVKKSQRKKGHVPEKITRKERLKAEADLRRVEPERIGKRAGDARARAPVDATEIMRLELEHDTKLGNAIKALVGRRASKAQSQ